MSFTNFSVANPGKQLDKVAMGIPNSNLEIYLSLGL